MDLTFDDHHDELRRASRRFLEETAALRPRLEEQRVSDPGLWRRAAGLGWAGLGVPEAAGGSGGGVVEQLVVAEELGRAVVAAPLIGTAAVAVALGRPGGERPDSRLANLAAGTMTGAWALLEPGGGWDAASVRLEARRHGAGFRLSGTKRFVEEAAWVTHLLVTARLDSELAQFLVPRDTPGVEVTTGHGLDLTRRFAEVRLVDVDAPPTALAGAPGAGTEAAVEAQRQLAVVLLCGDGIGGAARLLEMTVEYAGHRVQFGRPIGSFQAVKHKCASMLMWLEAARAATYGAAVEVAAATAGAREAAAVAKAVCGELLARLAGEALQIHGGIGFTWEHDLHLYLRRAKANELLFGTPAWHHGRIGRLIGV